MARMTRRVLLRQTQLIAAAGMFGLYAAHDAAPCLAATVTRPPPPAATQPADKPPPTATAPNPGGASPGGATNPAPSDAAPPYEPQLLRLSELLGALAYLQDLCGRHQGDIWRVKMAALLDAEAKTPVRKERLAGAFNRGFRGYALTYRLCTPNAQAIISRFLEESGKIAHDVARQYGPS
jgi:uncharacterized protein (TIGR02301 family)